MAQTTFTFADITGQPTYRIGLDLGIFIFITQDGRWHVRWNGNEKGQWPITFFYLWGGDITATKIQNAASYKFDSGQPDTFSQRTEAGNDILTFSGVVFSDEDGLDFDVDADEVHFSLTGKIKDRNDFLYPGLIFLGPDKINPTATDFVITRAAPPPPVQAPTLFWTDTGPADVQSALLTAAPAPASSVAMNYTAYGFALDPAGQKMYWSDTAKTINIANLDGSDLSTLVSGLSFVPYGLALDLVNQQVYCANQQGGEICRVDLANQESVVIVSGLSSPVDVALDLAGGKIYWVEYNGGSIGCANLDGVGKTYPVTGLTFPQGIALDAVNGIIYWADKTSIQRANTDGSNIVLMASPDTIALGNMLSRRVALDPTSSTLYWTDRGTFSIYRIAASAAAGTPEIILGGSASPALSPALLAPPLYSA